MVVRPNFDVVVVLPDLVDLGFGFDVTVFGNAHVDSNSRLVDVFPVQSRIQNGFVCAVTTNASSAGSSANLTTVLMAFGVKVADASNGFAKVADLVILNAAAAG